MREASVSMVFCDMLRCPAKLGIARVDSEGGLRSIGNAALAPGVVGVGLEGSGAPASDARADSNRGTSPGVSSDWGTISH